jgi:hypothetical protein
MSNGGRRLSVIRELHVLASSVESLRALAQRKLTGAYHGENTFELAVVMAGALHVLRDRVILLHDILMSKANPASIMCPSNEVDASRSGPYVLAEWSPEEQVRRATIALQADCYRRVLARLPSRKAEDKGRSN